MAPLRISTSSNSDWLLFVVFLLLSLPGLSQKAGDRLTPFELSGGKASATYAEAIDWYVSLAEQYPAIRVSTVGQTDAGLPLHEVVIASQGHHDPARVAMTDKVVVLINNGIHAGEPDGIDASMMLARDLVSTPAGLRLLERTVVVIIPVYNVGGALNRGAPTRVNQVGPEAYGFRGNAAHLDLNRDFIKADSRNALAFAAIFQKWQPEVFVDTHTTNGADYPAAMTYIATLASKAGSRTGPFLTQTLVPALEARMQTLGSEMCPYVNAFDASPDQGMAAFNDLPRYSSGYASLFHCLAFIAEAHMLKPFDVRVKATSHFLRAVLEETWQRHLEIGRVVHEDRTETMQARTYDVLWELDTLRRDSLLFHGYEAEMRPGALTGAPRVQYLRDRPYRRHIPWFPHYKPTVTVAAPEAYYISQACHEVIRRLEANGVRLYTLERDTLLRVEATYITEAGTSTRPWEGHFYHHTVKIRRERVLVPMRAGDRIAYVNQLANRYLVHALEPESADSYFRWNFFDAWLSRKEYYSDYTFEATAADFLKKNGEIRAEFERRKQADAAFAADPDAQLRWVYERSPYAEASYRRLPVYRWNP